MKPLQTWKKCKRDFKKPHITFRYGKINNVFTGSIYNDYNGNNRFLYIKFNDVSYKWKYDNVCFEAEPSIVITLFNRWKFVWLFEAPSVCSKGYRDNNGYWEAILSYLCEYDKDIRQTKIEFGWCRWVKDSQGNDIKISCWDNNWLTQEAIKNTRDIVK